MLRITLVNHKMGLSEKDALCVSGVYCKVYHHGDLQYLLQ